MGKKTDQQLVCIMGGAGKRRLQEIHKAAYSIEAAIRILGEESTRETAGEPELIGGYVSGGLEAGIHVLAGLIQQNTTAMLEWLGADAFDDMPLPGGVVSQNSDD